MGEPAGEQRLQPASGESGNLCSSSRTRSRKDMDRERVREVEGADSGSGSARMELSTLDGLHAIVPQMSGGISISFSDVAKRYDMRVVFRSISGEVDPGEVLVITGPNGSGKSTLLSILCGLLRPTRGEVLYRSADGGNLTRDAWGRHLGVVAPSMAVYEELTAMENLRFYARVRGLALDDGDHRDLLDRVGLDPERKTPVRGYSTGMAQRLKIAQALLHDPAVLFLDEPSSNLDPTGQDWLEECVRSLLEEERTIVLATNDRREMTWGSRNVSLAG